MNTIQINHYNIYADALNNIKISPDKIIINTINAHSYVVAEQDKEFRDALINSDVLLPDGEGIIFMAKVLKGKKLNKIAGADVHSYLLKLADLKGLKCFYLGASQSTLDTIRHKQETGYPNISFQYFSPPFKNSFNAEDNAMMLEKVNAFDPDILFVGMTAPKQEKWVSQNKTSINAKVICSIGAVFDFIAETKKRAPNWMIKMRLEWLHRACSSWRLTKRYLYSNPLFLIEVFKLKITNKI